MPRRFIVYPVAALLLVSCGGAAPPVTASASDETLSDASAGEPRRPSPREGEPEPALAPRDEAAIAEQWWEAVIAHDLETVVELSAFPFVWDAACRIYTEPTSIRDRLESEEERRPDARIAIVDARPLDPEAAELPERVRRSLARLADDEPSCDDELDALHAESASHPHRFILVTFTVGEDELGAVTRVSRLEGELRVTGFDN